MNSYIKTIRTITAGVHGIREATGDTDFPIRFFEVLLLVMEATGPNVSTLAERVGLAPAAASMILGKLNRDYGLICSVPDERDRRNKRFYLTSKGKEVALHVLRRATGKTISAFDVAIPATS